MCVCPHMGLSYSMVNQAESIGKSLYLELHVLPHFSSQKIKKIFITIEYGV